MSGIAIGTIAVGAASLAYGIYSSEEAKKEAKKQASQASSKNVLQVELAAANAQILENKLALQNAMKEEQSKLEATQKKAKSKKGIINASIIGGSLLVGTIMSIFIIKKK